MATVWYAHKLSNLLSASVRSNGNTWGKINGQDDEINIMMGPSMDSARYRGRLPDPSGPQWQPDGDRPADHALLAVGLLNLFVFTESIGHPTAPGRTATPLSRGTPTPQTVNCPPYPRARSASVLHPTAQRQLALRRFESRPVWILSTARDVGVVVSTVCRLSSLPRHGTDVLQAGPGQSCWECRKDQVGTSILGDDASADCRKSPWSLVGTCFPPSRSTQTQG